VGLEHEKYNEYMKNKLKLAISIIAGLLAGPIIVYAVVQSLNGATGNTQTFVNDTNITITTSAANNTHTLGWTGLIPISRGGTGNGAFTNGSVLFALGASISQDNSNLFWDNTNKRLGVGTNTPTTAVDVAGEVKATQVTTNTISATGSNQSISLNLTGTGKVLFGGDSIVVARLTSQPSSASTGQIYFDRTLKKFRGYNGTAWVSFLDTSTATVSVLVVAGGGQGGGDNNNFGGGAGGVVYDTDHTITGQAYTITIGAGGSSGGSNAHGADGNDSVFSDGVNTITAIAGSGGGAGYQGTPGSATQGSSGGGIGYGSNGGDNGTADGVGGGGGAGGIGGDATANQTGGAGGIGIDDASVGGLLSMASAPDTDHIAGGGGGGGYSPGVGGAGGNGGGGHGGDGPNDTSKTAGTANTGSGGGGSAKNGGAAGAAGGSGIVIISYPTGSITATGGTVTTSGGNTIHTFISSGTFTVIAIN